MRDAEPQPDEARHAGLHVCPQCGSRLVQPTCWEQAGDRGHWRLWRRCPECEWRCDGVHGEARDRRLRRASSTSAPAQLADGLKRSRAREHGAPDAPTPSPPALAADLITADDFGLSCSAARRRRRRARAAAAVSASNAAPRAPASPRRPSPAPAPGPGPARRWRRSGRRAPRRRRRRGRAGRRRGSPGSPLGGLDQRQRDGAVEQVGAARLAGALRRAGDVEDVVEQLEGEADLGAEGSAPVLGRRGPSRQAHSNSVAVFSRQRSR